MRVLGRHTLISVSPAVWTPAMFGSNFIDSPNKVFDVNNNKTQDQRPLAPLYHRCMFGPSGWVLHGQDIMNSPPLNDAVEVFEVGKPHRLEIACHRMYTRMENVTSRVDDTVCPGAKPVGYHTGGLATVGGTALAVLNTSDIGVASNNIYNFAVFSVNNSSPYYLETYYTIPEDMPSCGRPEGCICIWNWIHVTGYGGMESKFTFLGSGRNEAR
jgi:hypothetical protein